VLSRLEDHPFEQHVVEPDAVGQPGAALRELARHLGQPLLEELEQRGRDVLPGRLEPLGGGVSGEPEHVAGDAIEELRVPLLVAALQVEDPGHQGLVGGQLGRPGRIGERRELLGHGVLGHAEPGEERGQALTALGRKLRPGASVRSEVDRHRIPLQPGDDLREEVRPEAPPAHGRQGTNRCRSVRQRAGVM
jgi:hypothetical protein